MNLTVHDIDENEVMSYFSKRPSDSNKGTFGTAALICGSYSMAGAAIISAKACLHSGVGLVDVICPKSVYPIVAAAVPEAVFTPVNDELTDDDMRKVQVSLKKAQCVAVGCGCGQSEYTQKMLYTVIDHAKSPIIIDADGINCLCHSIDLLTQTSMPVILTPHPGEMARLTGESVKNIQQNRMRAAAEFVESNDVTLILKGHETIVMNPDCEAKINHSGNAGMATGGSGDMLCGILAAFIAQGMDIDKACEAAVYIHGLSGDICAEKYSMAFTTPTRMIGCLAPIFKQIENNINKS